MDNNRLLLIYLSRIYSQLEEALEEAERRMPPGTERANTGWIMGQIIALEPLYDVLVDLREDIKTLKG